MDSRAIYNISKALEQKILWTKIAAHSEWLHFLDNESAVLPFLENLINNVFSEDELLLVKGRNNSHKITVAELIQQICFRDFDNEILVWDLNFHHVMEISHIGVLRSGVYQGKISIPLPAAP